MNCRPVAVVVTKEEAQYLTDYYEDGDDYLLMVKVVNEDNSITDAAVFPNPCKERGEYPPKAMDYLADSLEYLDESDVEVRDGLGLDGIKKLAKRMRDTAELIDEQYES